MTKTFQEGILITFLKPEPADEELAIKDPLKYLNSEDDPSLDYTNIQRKAMDTWIAFA
jgi:hypothetical protein